MSFNAKLASGITKRVFTMWTAYLFTVLALLSLPAVLSGVFPKLGAHFPHWLIGASLIALIGWISSYFLQLVLLPIIGVGQNQQTAAVKDHIDGKHSEIQDLHSVLQRDILKLHEHFNIKQESQVMDEVKQHVEAALVAVEKLVEAAEHGPEVQLVKDKLTDIRDFLERVDATPSPEAPGESAPEVPAPTPEPVVEPPAPEVPEPVTEPPVNPEVPVTETETPAAPVDEPAPAEEEPTESPAAPSEPVSDPTTVTEPTDGSEPVTNEAGDVVTDPDAPR